MQSEERRNAENLSETVPASSRVVVPRQLYLQAPVASNRMLPNGAIYVMTSVRSTSGINKTKSTSARDAPFGLADALRRIFPTVLASYLQFRGWIRQETLCDRSSATFDLRQCASRFSAYLTGAAGATAPHLANSARPFRRSVVRRAVPVAGRPGR